MHNHPTPKFSVITVTYNAEAVLKSDCIREFSFTGTFSTQSLEEILQYFKMSSGIHWRYAKPHTATADKRIIELY